MELNSKSNPLWWLLTLVFIGGIPGTLWAEGIATFAFVRGQNTPFYQQLEQGIQEKANELGIRLIFSEYPKIWNTTSQIPLIESIAKISDLHLVIIAPASPDALSRSLQKLHRKGIQIVTLETLPTFPTPLTHIEVDHEGGGRQAALFLAQAIGERGQVYINTTSPNPGTIGKRMLGFLEEIKNFSNIEVMGIDIIGTFTAGAQIAEVDYNQLLRTRARFQTLEMLQRFPDIKAIFTTNAFSGEGVHQILQETGLSGAIKVFSWEGTDLLMKALDSGEIDLMLVRDPKEMGAQAVIAGYRSVVSREKVPERTVIRQTLITQENIGDFEAIPFIKLP